MEDLGSLVARAQQGDLDAFGEVVVRFQDMAFGYAYSILGNAEDAQDAAQEAFIIAYRNLGDLRERERFAGWLRRIVLSACRAIGRKRVPTVPLAEAETIPSGAGDPDRVVEQQELRQLVHAAINSLSAPNRMATVLYYINGYGIQEVAQFLQVPAGTVKRRLHDSRQQLKERMVTMVKEGLRVYRPTAEFRQEVIKRIGHWARFKGTEEEKVEMVEADPEWIRLVEVEIALEPMSQNCREIRKRIASLEACHEHYAENVAAITGMIGPMEPGPVLDCGQACEARMEQAKTYGRALRRWLRGDGSGADAGEYDREVCDLLGERTEAKVRLVEHLIKKLDDNSYSVYADEEEDFERTESRIQHLEICNYNWQENLRIVLREIAAGKRLFAWHTPDGYNAHGDCPDRVAQLKDMMTAVAAWAEGRSKRGGRWGRMLGDGTPEKRWLAASLCKHVSIQHGKRPGATLLKRPRL